MTFVAGWWVHESSFTALSTFGHVWNFHERKSKWKDVFRVAAPESFSATLNWQRWVFWLFSRSQMLSKKRHTQFIGMCSALISPRNVCILGGSCISVHVSKCVSCEMGVCRCISVCVCVCKYTSACIYEICVWEEGMSVCSMRYVYARVYVYKCVR